MNLVRPNDRGFLHAGYPVQNVFYVIGEYMQPFWRHDHFLLPPANDQMTRVIKAPDVSSMKPSILESRRSFPRSLIVAGSHILSANEYFAIQRDLYCNSGDGRAYRTLLG